MNVTCPWLLKKSGKIADKAILQFSVRNIVVHHRTGVLLPGEEAVIIVVSDGHRDAVLMPAVIL